jgi:ParB family chromosome partitioning protein
MEMLEAGELSEGHGRALLGASGNDVRRRLGRDAVRAGWSVRETENRVRLAGQPKARPQREPVDSEEAAALEEAGDALEAALGHEVAVRAKGSGISVELRFDDLTEAHALARSLRKRAR